MNLQRLLCEFKGDSDGMPLAQGPAPCELLLSAAVIVTVLKLVGPQPSHTSTVSFSPHPFPSLLSFHLPFKK